MAIAFTRIRKFGRSNAGSTAVEFALAAPILFLLMFAIVEFGRAWWTKSSLQYAIERAARYAVVCVTGACPSDAAIQSYASTQVTAESVASSAFGVTHPAGVSCVTYSYQYTPWFVGDFGPLAGVMTFTGSTCRAHS
jgi:Flp pilus assembly protein TadG